MPALASPIDLKLGTTDALNLRHPHCIPFVALFTQVFAYRRLTKTGMTLWDTSASAVVPHKVRRAARACVYRRCLRRADFD
jgi:hypothetical protein